MGSDKEETKKKKTNGEANASTDTSSSKDSTASKPDINGQGTSDGSDRLKILHDELIKVQSNTPMEGVPEDYGKFQQWFQDPGYRKKFHQFLMDQQSQGRIHGIPKNLNQFEGILTGQIKPGEQDKGMALGLTGMDIPKHLRQLDLDVEQSANAAFDSTESLDQYDSMEAYQKAQHEQAGQAMNDMSKGPGQPRISKTGALHWQGQDERRIKKKRRERTKQEALAELQMKEAKQDLVSGKITPTEYKNTVKNIHWPDPGVATEAAKGVARGIVSVLPSQTAEFLGQFYFDPFDSPLNGPDKTTKKMRENFKKAADYFESLGEEDKIRINRNLKGKTLEDIWQNPALLPSWLAAKAGETAPSMLPGIGAMKVLGPVSTAGELLAATAGAAPIEIGSQLKDMRKTAEKEGRKATEGEKALAVASGMASAVFEGIADRYLFKYVEDALAKSGLGKAAKEEITKEVGQSLSRRFYMLLKSSGKQSSIEGLTEGVQQVMGNVGAKYGWDPDRNLMDGVPEATAVGSAVGGTTTFTFGTVAESMAAQQQLDSEGQQQQHEGPDQTKNSPKRGVTISIPTDGSIQEQLKAVESEKQRIEQEKIQREKDKKPTLNHDMALSRLSIIEQNIHKQMAENRQEAIKLKIKQNQKGPQPQETNESINRRKQAYGKGYSSNTSQQAKGQSASQAQQVAPAEEAGQPTGQRSPQSNVDVTGREFLSPEEYQNMSPEEQKTYNKPIKQDVEQPSGKSIQLDSGLVPYAKAATSMGYEINSGDSGLQVDHPGSRNESGAPKSRGTQGHMVFNETSDPQRNANVKSAARQAGLNIEQQEAPQKPGIKISLPYTRDGSSQQEIYTEANQITDARNPDLKDHNFQLWQTRRNSILEEEVIPDHGGVQNYNDQQVLDHWEKFTQELEKNSGYSPDQRATSNINEDADLNTQIKQITEETDRILRNRDIAETRGEPTEEFDKSIRQLQQRRNEIHNQQLQQMRDQQAQQGTIEDVMGDQVTMGDYSGTLTQDSEGNIVIDTGDNQIVEVPDTYKDTSTKLSDTELQRATQPPVRTMQLTDPKTDQFQLTETDRLTGEPQQTKNYSWLSSNTNDAGEVQSVTMADEDGNRRTFRDPDIVEQVMWQQYFGRGTQPNVDPEAFTQAVDQAHRELTPQGVNTSEFRLDDGDPRMTTVFDKFDQGQPLTEAEQIRALDWIDEKTQQLQQSGANNAPQLFNQLIAFENEIIDNNPQPNNQQQQSIDENQNEVPGSSQEQTDANTGQSEQQANQGVELTDSARKLIRDYQQNPNMPDMVMSDVKEGETWQEQVAKENGITPTEDMTTGDLVNKLLDRAGEKSIELKPHHQMPEEYVQHRIDELPDGMSEEEISNLIDNKFIPEHKTAVAQALEDNRPVSEEILSAYPDLLESTTKDLDNKEIPPEETPRRHTETMTKEKFREQLNNNADITAEQVDGIINLISQRARVWAEQNGRDEAEYWKRRLAGITKQPPITDGQANEVIESYGDDINSMQDVGNRLEEKTGVSYSENGNYVQLPDGRIMEYQSARQLGFFDENPNEPAPEETIPAHPGMREITQGDNLEFTMQERQYIPWDNIKPVSRNQQVRTDADIAFMFSQLENAAIEQGYIVGIDRNGEAIILNVGMGGPAHSAIDHTAVTDFVQRYDIQEVTLVHNHPSGNLKSSRADLSMHKKIKERLPAGVRMRDSIIINRNSGLYGVFDEVGPKGTSDVPTVEQRAESLEGPYATTSRDVPVFSWGRFKNTKNYSPPGERFQITSPGEVAQFIESRKFSLADKYSAILLNHQKEVIGFLHMKNQPQIGMAREGIGHSKFATELRTYMDRSGATSSVLVSNLSPKDFRLHKGYFGELSKSFSKSGDGLADVLTVQPGEGSRRTYDSMRASGVLESRTDYKAFQEPVNLYDGMPGKQAISFDNDERAIIHLFENEDDFETIVRQLGKVFRRDLPEDDLHRMEAWLNVEDGKWTPQHEEKFATRFVKYLADGKAPNEEVKGLFTRFKEWLQNIYQSLSQQDDAVIINKDQRRIFDRLFSSPIEEVRNSDSVFKQNGSDIKISFKPDGSEDHPGHYAVLEARDLQASHNTDGSLNSKHVISKGQPRDRRGRKYIAQHKQIAQKLNPDSITGNDLAFYGAPITNARGEVIQGNGRSISLQLAYSENPGKAQNYKGYLVTQAERFGLDKNQVAQMKRPVLVRVMDVNDKEAIRLGNIKNTAEARLDPIDEAKASVRNLPEADRQKIGRIIDSSDAETIRSILDDVGPRIVDLLPDIDRSEFLDNENKITVKGKDFMADVFRSLIFDSDTGRDTIRKFSEMPHDVIRGIERSYGTLIRYLNTPADLSTTLQNAVDIVWNVRKNKSMKTASDFVNQQDVFSQGNEAYTNQEVQLAQILLDVQRPSSAIMKQLGTTGTQTAIRTLIRNYANRIDGETNLFERFETPGNTEAGAKQAFEEAFRPNQSQQQEGGGQEQQRSPAKDKSGSKNITPTVNMASRNSGIDHIRDLQPQGDYDIAWADVDQIKSKKAKQLAKKIKNDPDGSEVGMRSIINFLNDAVGIEMRVGKVNTTTRNPAHYQHSARLVRAREPGDVAVFHEAAHGIHHQIQDVHPDFLEQFDWDQIKEPLEEAGISRASADSPAEYFAEWARSYILNPEFTSSLDLTTNLVNAMKADAPELLDNLQDAARLYKLHSERGPVAMLRAANKDTGPDPNPLTEKAKDVFDRFTFTALGRNWAIHQWERDAVYKAFTDIYDDNNEGKQKAREFMKDIRETKADFRLAHQITNRIPGIVKDALHGSGLKIMSTGDGVIATQDQIDQLREAGFNISDELKNKLTDPAGEHGNQIVLHDHPIEGTLQKIGKDAWPQFEFYSQYKVSLERLIKKLAPYTGITEVKPSVVAQKVNEFEQANPEWKGYFNEINDYMDKLLLTGYLGGDKSLGEAIRMKSAYEFYMPLLKDVEGKGENTTRDKTIPEADAGFRGVKGGDHPMLPLLKAIQQRTYQVVDAYYQNRAMLAPIYMAEEMNRRDDIPMEAKVPINRLVSPIQLDTKKVADLKPEEMAKVVADYLNNQRREEAAASMGVDPSEVMQPNPIKPEQINIASTGMPIWRGADPQGINIIAAKRNGARVFYQLKNPYMYDYFARTEKTGGAAKFWNTIAKATAPWKKSITNTLDFIGRNLPRDASTGAYFGLPPEYTVDDQTVGDFMKSITPGYYFASGMLAKLTGNDETDVVDTELLSRTMYDSISEERQFNESRFKQILKEGLFPQNWDKMDWKDKAAHYTFVAPNVLLNKPFHLFMEATGMSRLSTAVEEAPRIGAYLQMKHMGHSDEAAMMAHDFVSGNFGERPGNSTIHAAYRAGGFINPSTQIFSETLHRLVHPDSRIRWQQGLRLGMGVAVPTAIAWAISTAATPEKRRKELENRTNQERKNYMPLFGAYRVPFDYGPTGAIQAFTWISLDNAANKSKLPAGEFAKTVLSRMGDTPVSGGLSPIFQMAVGPQLTSLIEGAVNYQFYWKEPIVPPWLQEYPPEQQAFTTTPNFYKTLGKISHMSPLKIQHVVNNVTGNLLGRALEFKDKIARGEPITAADIPLGGKLVQRTPDGWYSQSTQKITDLDQKFQSLKRSRDDLEKANTGNPEDIKRIRQLDMQIRKLAQFHKTANTLQQLYKQVKELRKNKNWQQADQLEKQMTEIAASILAQSGTVKTD